MTLSETPTKFLLSAVVLVALTACGANGNGAATTITKVDSATSLGSTRASTVFPGHANSVAVDAVMIRSDGGAFAPPVAAD